MTVTIDHLVVVVEEYLEKVLDINEPEFNQITGKIAYYYAMKQAALDDPLDDDAEHSLMCNYFDDNLKELTEKYMELVNERV